MVKEQKSQGQLVHSMSAVDHLVTVGLQNFSVPRLVTKSVRATALSQLRQEEAGQIFENLSLGKKGISVNPVGVSNIEKILRSVADYKERLYVTVLSPNGPDSNGETGAQRDIEHIPIVSSAFECRRNSHADHALRTH